MAKSKSKADKADAVLLCSGCGFPVTPDEHLRSAFGGGLLCDECSAAKPAPVVVNHQAKAPAKPKAGKVQTHKLQPLSSATWKQKDGTVTKLSAMTSSHLWFAIRMLERFPDGTAAGYINEKAMLLYRERERRLREAAKYAAEMGQVYEVQPNGTLKPMHDKKRWAAEFYVIKQGEPVPASAAEFGEWLQHAKETDRRIAATMVQRGVPGTAPGDVAGVRVDVSTVFLGLNHAFGDGEPLLYETMVFGGPHDGRQLRCSTREEAVALHRLTVEEESTFLRQAVRAQKAERAAAVQAKRKADILAEAMDEAAKRAADEQVRATTPGTINRLITLEDE